MYNRRREIEIHNTIQYEVASSASGYAHSLICFVFERTPSKQTNRQGQMRRKKSPKIVQTKTRYSDYHETFAHGALHCLLQKVTAECQKSMRPPDWLDTQSHLPGNNQSQIRVGKNQNNFEKPARVIRRIRICPNFS